MQATPDPLRYEFDNPEMAAVMRCYMEEIQPIRGAVEGIEVVYHFVSTTLPKTSNDDPIYDVRSNLIDTLQLLEACAEAGVLDQGSLRG